MLLFGNEVFEGDQVETIRLGYNPLWEESYEKEKFVQVHMGNAG